MLDLHEEENGDERVMSHQRRIFGRKMSQDIDKEYYLQRYSRPFTAGLAQSMGAHPW